MYLLDALFVNETSYFISQKVAHMFVHLHLVAHMFVVMIPPLFFTILLGALNSSQPILKMIDFSAKK